MACSPGCPYCAEQPAPCPSALRRLHDFIRGWDAARTALTRDQQQEGTP
jgi:hypothetical protein